MLFLVQVVRVAHGVRRGRIGLLLLLHFDLVVVVVVIIINIAIRGRGFPTTARSRSSTSASASAKTGVVVFIASQLVQLGPRFQRRRVRLSRG